MNTRNILGSLRVRISDTLEKNAPITLIWINQKSPPKRGIARFQAQVIVPFYFPKFKKCPFIPRIALLFSRIDLLFSRNSLLFPRSAFVFSKMLYCFPKLLFSFLEVPSFYLQYVSFSKNAFELIALSPRPAQGCSERRYSLCSCFVSSWNSFINQLMMPSS